MAVGSFRETTPRFLVQTEKKGIYFDLASLTKPILTVPLVIDKIEKSHIPLDTAQVRDFFSDSPQILDSFLNMRAVALLRHQAGLVPWRNFWTNRLDPTFDSFSVTREERFRFFFDRLKESPQQGFSAEGKVVYSDIGYILLGLILEARNDQDLSGLFTSYCRELGAGVEASLFFPTREGINHETFVPTSFCKVRERWLQGEVHDENAAALGGICGHAGLFGSGEGLVRFLGSYFRSEQGQRQLKQNRSLFDVSVKGEYLLGWQKEEFPFAPGTRVFKHLGFTGTGVWVLPDLEKFIIILTNRVRSERISSWINKLRLDLCETCWGV